MCTKSGQNGPKRAKFAKKFRFCTKPGTNNLILHSIFKAEVQLWPFLPMGNFSKLGKKNKTDTLEAGNRPKWKIDVKNHTN